MAPLTEVDLALQHLKPKTMAGNVVFKIELPEPATTPVELFWIDQAGSKHRRKLINTHTQKRSRRLKRLNNASASQLAHGDAELLTEVKQPLDCDATGVKKTLQASEDPRLFEKEGVMKCPSRPHWMGENTLCCTSLAPGPFSASVLLGLDPFDSLSISLKNQVESLLKFAQTLAFDTEVISSHWGKSCVGSLGLSWCFSYPVKLLNLLERASAYIDMVQGLGASPRTIFWRHASIQRLTILISDPHTRHGEEVLSGIIALLHGYLHRYRGAHKGSAMTDRPHSAGLRDFVSHVGGWNRLDLPLQVEEYVRMAMIMTSLRLGSYLDDFEASSVEKGTLVGWHVEVNQVASLFTRMDAWALQQDQISTRESFVPPLDELGRLLAQSSGICNHCHKLFVLVWLGLTRWHSRSSPGKYEDILHTLNHRYQSLPYRALPDFSWAIVSSRAGDKRSHWQTIDILKVLHRTRPSTQEQVCQWLFDFVRGRSQDGHVGLQSCSSEQLLRDALEGLPKGCATDVQRES